MTNERHSTVSFLRLADAITRGTATLADVEDAMRRQFVKGLLVGFMFGGLIALTWILR